jgi:hypothetical protein
MDEPPAPFAHVLFAFALYGSGTKYTRGMIKNCEMLAEHFPGCRVGIALGDDVPPEIVRALEEICGQVVLVKLGFSGAAAMAERMFLLEENPAFADCTVVFVRDADSRVHSRDRSCIRAFLDEEVGGEGAGSLRHLAHTIRDHIYHTQPIMGGLFGLRREGLDGLIGGRLRPRYRAFLEACGCSSGYGTDERFLAEVVYPLVQEALLVHTDLWQAPLPAATPVLEFDSEPCHPVPPATFAPLPAPLSSEHEFCGNVVEVGMDSAETPAFSYCEPPLAHIAKSSPRACVNLLCHTLANDFGPLSRMLSSFPSSQRYAILWDMLTAVYQLEACALLPASFFELWETTHVDEAIILYSNHYIQKAYTRIVGTSTLGEEGGQEGAARSCLVIVYCNIPMDCRNLPCSAGVVYRHPAYVFSLTHTVFVSHPCWKPFGQIYVINLEERTDRFMEVMVELSRVHAPLDRVTHYRARKDGDRLSAYRGATKNHVDVLESILACSSCFAQPSSSSFAQPSSSLTAMLHYLILEDDITFTSLVPQMHRDLVDAVDTLDTEYDILFLAASKFHEIRASQIAPSLLCVSRQECTTSSAYMVNSRSVERVLSVAREGLEGMVVDGRLDPERVHENCIDRYWSRLNPRDRMFIFRRKMAYQRPTFSNLTGNLVTNFD